jgi:hypothetical protein
VADLKSAIRQTIPNLLLQELSIKKIINGFVDGEPTFLPQKTVYFVGDYQQLHVHIFLS